MSLLDGLNHYGDTTLSDLLIDNLVQFLNHGFLEIGAYINVPSGKVSYNGGDMSRMNPVFATGATNYTIWRGTKNNWVWESNITLKYASGTQPIVATGIYLNGSSTPTGYYIDFSRGQVVFNSPQPSNSLVQVPHTLRAVQVYRCDSNEYREIESNWRQVNTSGIYNNQYKAYLPAVFVDISKFETIRGSQLGSRMKFVKANVNFEIFTNNDYELKRLIDILYMLEEKSIKLFHPENSPRPLNYRGELINPSSTYVNLIEQYPYGDARFNGEAMTYKSPPKDMPIRRGRVEVGLEFDAIPF